MHKMLKLALGVVMAVSLAVPAMAQENFPDVPTNHWAYEALKNLKDKVLFGYPDGLYRGNRPMSRYEFAVAINQLWQIFSGRVGSLEEQVAALEKMIKDGGDTSGLQSLRDQLAALTKRVDSLESGYAELKKLVGEFEKELASLGVDVDALKKDVADLEARVSKLEKMKPNVLISGDVNFVMFGGYSDNGRFGLSQTGESVGIGRSSYAGGFVGAQRDLSVLHEAAISFSSTNEEGPKFKGTVVYGNTLSTFGSLTGVNGGTYAEGPSDLYINELYASFDHSVFGRGFSAVVGRYGHKNLDFVMKRSDRTPYYSNERWDNGKYIIDGAALSFDVAGSKVNLFGGRTFAESFDNKTPLTPAVVRHAGYAATGKVDRMYGADTSLKFGGVDLGLAYVINDSDTNVSGDFNQTHAMGAEAKFNLSGVNLKAGVAKSIVKQNDDIRRSSGTTAYYGEVGYEQEKWGISGGYRDIEAYFANPGAWGRIGTQYSPTGIRGWHGKAWIKPTDALTLYAKGQFYEGRTWKGLAGNLLLGNNDDVQSVIFGAEYKVNDVFSVDASYEDANWKLNSAPDPYQRWFTLGFNWTMSDKAMMRTFWQYSDANDKGTGLFAAYGLGPSTRYKGGLIGAQLSLKF